MSSSDEEEVSDIDQDDPYLAQALTIDNLDNLIEELLAHRGKLIVSRSQLSAKLIGFLDSGDNCYQTSVDALQNGQLIITYCDRTGQGGSTLIDKAFKHNDKLVSIGYCIFCGSITNDCYNTEIEFKLI